MSRTTGGLKTFGRGAKSAGCFSTASSATAHSSVGAQMKWSDGSEGPVSASFLRRANEAAFWEAWVGAVLARAGFYTTHPPFYADGRPGDNGDLLVSQGNGTHTVEVKSKKVHFMGPDTFPKYGDVLLCSQNSWLRKWPGMDKTPVVFLLVSSVTGGIVYIPRGTPVAMGKEVVDRSRGTLNKYVVCHRDNLRPLQDFVELVHGQD